MSITGYPYLNALYYFPPTWAALVASFFVIITLSLSLFLLIQHLSAYKNPEEQKFLIGVILMVPCYAVESFVSLMNPSISVDCEILRDCYEAFAMYCFGRYLVACLGGEKNTIIIQHHQIPKPQFMQGLMVGSMTGSCRFYDASGLPAGSDVSQQFKQSPNCGAFHVNAACKDLWKHFCSCPVGILPGESVKLLVARVQI